MYVCVCQAVTDREIHQAAKNGAKSLRDLRRDLGLGLFAVVALAAPVSA